jgi:hypothetical protein
MIDYFKSKFWNDIETIDTYRPNDDWNVKLLDEEVEHWKKIITKILSI